MEPLVRENTRSKDLDIYIKLMGPVALEIRELLSPRVDRRVWAPPPYGGVEITLCMSEARMDWGKPGVVNTQEYKFTGIDVVMIRMSDTGGAKSKKSGTCMSSRVISTMS